MKTIEDEKKTIINGLILISIISPIKKLNQCITLSGTTFWRLVDFSEFLFSEFNKLKKTKIMLEKKYNQKVKENNNSFKKEWVDVLSKDIIIPFEKIQILKDEVPLGKNGLSALEVLQLKCVIDFI
jgi:hypothetical protein